MDKKPEPGQNATAAASSVTPAAANEDREEFSRTLMEEGVPLELLQANSGDANKKPVDAAGSIQDPADDPDAQDPADDDPDTPDPADDDPDGQDPKANAALPPHIQESLDKRIGKEVAKRKILEEQLESQKAKLSELEAKLTEQGDTAMPAAPQGATAKVYQAKSEQELDAREEYLWSVEEFCLQNRGGYEGTDPEKDPSYSETEIATRLIQVRKERERDLPRARKILAERLSIVRDAATAYPELKTAENEIKRELISLAKRVPGLWMVPEITMMVADMVAGRRARLARKTSATAAHPRKAPAVPGGGSVAIGPGVAPGKSNKKSSYEQFADADFDEEALAAALR